mmetsp:Transcript_95240/g.139068  ORF Transcript_95240/g.139068 Transcript_95240/m.139068 type:complete len:203 (-) Transcript_95240:838-1446(-)
MILGGMASLSYSLSVVSSVPELRSLTAGLHQSSIFLPGVSGSFFLSGFKSSMIRTAFMASCTPRGGLPMALTASRSGFLMVSSALSASFRMGMASARSASHSSLTAFTAAACLAVASSSFMPTAFCSSTPGMAASTLAVRASVSFCACASPGCRSMSSCFMLFTDSSARASASRPPVYRRCIRLTCPRRRPSSVLYVLMSSR